MSSPSAGVVVATNVAGSPVSVSASAVASTTFTPVAPMVHASAAATPSAPVTLTLPAIEPPPRVTVNRIVTPPTGLPPASTTRTAGRHRHRDARPCALPASGGRVHGRRGRRGGGVKVADRSVPEADTVTCCAAARGRAKRIGDGRAALGIGGRLGRLDLAAALAHRELERHARDRIATGVVRLRDQRRGQRPAGHSGLPVARDRLDRGHLCRPGIVVAAASGGSGPGEGPRGRAGRGHQGRMGGFRIG